MENLSIILPVYNIEISKIDRCFKSIYSQIGESDEIIFVDDGSKEEIASFLDTLQRNNVYIFHQNNSGVSIARNNGLNHAKNDWIMFIDPDDYLKEDTLNNLRRYLKTNNDIYIFDYYATFDEKNIFKYNFFRTNEITKEDIYRNLLDDHYYINGKDCIIGCGVPWAHIYKKSFIENNQLSFDPNCIRQQDNIFNMYATSKTDKIELVHYAFYIYCAEHCMTYFKQFKRKSLEYLPYLSELKTNFYLNESTSENILRNLVRVNYSSLQLLLSTYILNKDVKDSKEDKKKYLLYLKNFEPFKMVWKYKKYISFKSRIILFLYKTNQLWILRMFKRLKRCIKIILRKK